MTTDENFTETQPKVIASIYPKAQEFSSLPSVSSATSLVIPESFKNKKLERN